MKKVLLTLALIVLSSPVYAEGSQNFCKLLGDEIKGH